MRGWSARLDSCLAPSEKENEGPHLLGALCGGWGVGGGVQGCPTGGWSHRVLLALGGRSCRHLSRGPSVLTPSLPTRAGWGGPTLQGRRLHSPKGSDPVMVSARGRSY